MGRKSEIERLYRQSREMNGYVSPQPVLQGGNPLRKPGSNGGGCLKWLVLLVLLGAGAWFGYGPVMAWLNGGLSRSPMAPAGAQPPAQSTKLADAGATGSLPVGANGLAARSTVAQVKAYLTPSDAEMDQLYSYVVNSPFVAENLQYRDRLKNIPFIYTPTNDTVNAAAGRRIVEKDGKKGLAFHTVFYGGAARYARLVGLAAAMQDAGHKDMLKKFVTAMPRSFCASCNDDDCVRFIAENGLGAAFDDEKIRQRALSYSSGTIVSVLAHECGHHALGHLLGFSEKRNLEIDRNQEREADSFASSIISASPFGEYIFAGTLFWHYAVAVQADRDSDAASNHPLSKERFENFVRANAEKAAAMGIVLNN